MGVGTSGTFPHLLTALITTPTCLFNSLSIQWPRGTHKLDERIFLPQTRNKRMPYGTVARRQTHDNRHQLDRRRTVISIRRPSDPCGTVQYLARVLILVQVLLC
jgi:hypothetical protein